MTPDPGFTCPGCGITVLGECSGPRVCSACPPSAALPPLTSADQISYDQIHQFTVALYGQGYTMGPHLCGEILKVAAGILARRGA